MVSLEQIRAFEARVEKAVTLIDKLRRENAELEQRLVEASRSVDEAKAAYSELESRSAASLRMTTETEATIEELRAKLQAAEAESASSRERAVAAEQKSFDLESKAEELKREQSRIEEGLTHALQKLDAFEDLVMGISVGEAQTEGDKKVEAVAMSPATSASQPSPFPGESSSEESPDGDQLPGTEHELDIF
ncbi:MAG TPA: hypothetical protein DIT55_10205 [Spirochaetaceae bacterium]|jgi:DNA repair exonuclease SbcCD ATPase subunit|nr:hypothetical protein [Spirochaetaceae bacterium]